MATGTITLDPTPAPALGATITFSWTAEGLHGNQKPRIQVIARDADDNAVVYAEAFDAEGNVFKLGGDSSDWLNNQTGPANCEATLYFWDMHGQQQVFVPLADPITFVAAG